MRIPVALESRRSPHRSAPRALYPQICPQGNLSFRCVLKRSKVCYNGTFCGVQKSKGVRLGEEPACIKLLSTFFDFSPSEPSAPSGPRLWRLHYLLRLRPNVCLGPSIHDVEMVRDWFSVKLLMADGVTRPSFVSDEDDYEYEIFSIFNNKVVRA